MKNILCICLFLLGCLAVQAQHEYTIEGKVKGLKDGTVVTLFLSDGRVGTTVATDTVKNESFRFQRAVSESSGIDRLDISCYQSPEFPPMSLAIFGAPDAQIKVSGTNNLIYTWKVDSPVKEQQEHNQFVEASRDLWDAYQGLFIQRGAMRSAPKAEREVLAAAQDSIMNIIGGQDIALMQQMPVPVSTVWMDKLFELSMNIKFLPGFAYKQETIALYNRLSEEQKNTVRGLEITANLFPPTIVKEGDEMADADLFDLNGNVHHLSDFKGKYILLDFWSSGCGPCIMALPEMGEIQEQYKDRLTIVSLSTDTKKRWVAASAEHKMTWVNLNDLKLTAGLYAKYGVKGIPNYVLISPEGKIIKMWMGYGEGSLKLKMRRFIDASSHEMVINQRGKVKIVDYPSVTSTNTEMLEIKQVELTDSATVIRLKAYQIPKNWIRLSPDTRLVGEGGSSYTIKKTEGITLGKEFYMPESGEAEFSITFEPLPLKSKSFDFMEGTAAGDWQINGVKLVK